MTRRFRRTPALLLLLALLATFLAADVEAQDAAVVLEQDQPVQVQDLISPELGDGQDQGDGLALDPPVNACRSHTLALQYLAQMNNLLSSPALRASPLIAPQTFLTQANPVYGGPGGILGYWKRSLLGSVGIKTGVKGSKSTERVKEELKKKGQEVKELLRLATEEDGCLDAWGTRGHFALLPPAPVQQNVRLAFRSYKTHADLTGNATAHYMLGFFYATGFGSVCEIDPGKSVLHYTFASLQNHQAASQALAYRSFSGISVPESCLVSLSHYQPLAKRAFEHFSTGPPGGRTLTPTTTKVSDLSGGVYGSGASEAGTGAKEGRAVMKAGKARAGGESWSDILEYYQFHADRGGHFHAVGLGRMYYFGSIYTVPGGVASGADGVGMITQDFGKAREYFLRVARIAWPNDDNGYSSQQKGRGGKPKEPDAMMVEAAMYLGRMSLRGEGIRKDYKKARIWFERAIAARNERESLNSMGIIYRDGLGVPSDANKALDYFQKAAGQDLAEAQVNIGKIHWDRGEINPSFHYFQLAARGGSPFEAYYYLGLIHADQTNIQISQGIRPDSCSTAVVHFKSVVERGSWTDDVVGDADRAWQRGETDKAVVGWWMAAERGYESAQNNIAYTLDQDTALYSVPWRRHEPDTRTAQISLNNYIRSAAQINVDALVKVGDYYFKGLADPDRKPQYEKAAGFYQTAAGMQVSALALFNLGHCYEHGLGVSQDFHLAKRNYDLALETNSEAQLPVMLALFKLYIRSILNSLFGDGSQKSLSLFSSADDPSGLSFSGLLTGDLRKKLEAFKLQSGFGSGTVREEHILGDESHAGDAEENAGWGDDSGRDRQGGFDPHLDMDGWNDNDDGDVVEILAIMLLMLSIGGMVYLRGRWTRQRQEEDARRRGEPHADAAAADAPPPPPPPAPPGIGPPFQPLAF